MLLDLIGTTDPKSIVKPNWIKIRTFHTLMRPISEGLALFCEFDVCPRPSDEIWSYPMLWLYSVTKPLNEQETKSPATFGDALYLRLMKVRQSKSFIRRKQCLLLHPIDVSEGGYLSGYMTVRQLWYWAAIKCNRFNNIDFFYRYLISYFFSDLRLVWALLEATSSIRHSIDRILLAFQLRLREFYDLDFEQEANKFKAQQEHSPFVLDLSVALGKPNDTWPYAGKELQKMIARVSITDPKSDAEHLLQWTGMYMAQRELLCLANVPVELKNAEDGSVEACFEGKRFAKWEYRKGMEGREGVGNIACYISLLHERIVHCITQGTELVSFRVFEFGGSPVPASQIESYSLNFLELKKLNDGLLTIFKAFVEQSSPDNATKRYDAKLKEGVSGIYARYALRLEEDEFAARYKQMVPTGFLDLLGSMDLVETLAAVTLGASLRANIPDVIDMFKSIQPDLEERIKALDTRLKDLDYSVYVQQPTRILSFV
jgi:hypothetical protein